MEANKRAELAVHRAQAEGLAYSGIYPARLTGIIQDEIEQARKDAVDGVLTFLEEVQMPAHHEETGGDIYQITLDEWEKIKQKFGWPDYD